MKKLFLLCCIATACLFSSCGGEKYTYALISTSMGDIKVKLYNNTPKHRDNFIKLAKEGYYDGTLFHRVIPNFMIQGGDPDSKGAAPGARLGAGGPGYRVDAEIKNYHYRGALAGARDQNPQKASSGSQFYIVTGKQVTAPELDGLQQRKGIVYSQGQRDLYTEIGGSPFLDGDYTVYGEVVEGIEVADAIANAARGQADRPNQDISMTVKIL